jgi:hypothetical protein
MELLEQVAGEGAFAYIRRTNNHQSAIQFPEIQIFPGRGDIHGG